tara:strand:- start:156 stop:326 length:171 start_codon:yes stop_codon:yes gene_type:complete
VSGEHPEGRKTMDALIRRSIKHGADPQWAREKARKAVREVYHGEKSDRPRGHRRDK